MNKEQFLYDFLVKYNQKEKLIQNQYNSNINDAWIKNDSANGEDGLIIYILRNLLAHDTEETLNNLKNVVNYDEVISWLDNFKVDEYQKLKLLEFILKSSKIKNELEIKGFKKFENSNIKNVYYCYYRKLNNVYFNIFLHPTGKFITCSISSYNHSKVGNGREYYKDTDIYIESEIYQKEVILKLFKGEDTQLVPKLEIYLKIKPKNLTITQLNYCKMCDGEYIEKRFIENRDCDYENTARLSYYNNLNDLQNIFKADFDLELLSEINSEVIRQYKEINQVLQKIGLQL